MKKPSDLNEPTGLISKSQASQFHISLLIAAFVFCGGYLKAQESTSLFYDHSLTAISLLPLPERSGSSNVFQFTLDPSGPGRMNDERALAWTSQRILWRENETTGDLLGEDSDSMPHPPTRRLLPANMSFMERGLWGENGFLRQTGIAAPLTPEVRMNELSLRRTMLSLHQIGGFATLGLMLTTAYFGQRTIDDSRSRALRNDHQTFVAATIVSYSATGLLAILSPPPLIRRDEVSTTTIHKALAWVHAAGMIITPILGSMIGRQRDSQKAHFHQIAGYITTATFAAAMITVTF